MNVSLRPALFVIGALTVCGLGTLKSASAAPTTSLGVDDATELGHKDGGAVDLLESVVAHGKDGGSIELAVTGHKDGGSIELAVTGGKDGGYVSAEKTDGGK